MKNLTKKFFTAVILPLFLISSGCSVQKHFPSTNLKVIHKDSLVVHTEIVAVNIPQESHSIITDKRKSHLETTVAESDAEIDSLGYLHHSIKNKDDSLRTKIQYVDRIQIRDSIITEEIPVEVEKEVRYVPKIYKITFWFCIIELLVTILCFIRKIKVFPF